MLTVLLDGCFISNQNQCEHVGRANMRLTRVARTRAILLAGSLALAPSISCARSNPFTIEDVIGTPFPSSLVAAPVGRSAAWVFNDHGARNIWVVDGGQARPITAFAKDDGYDVGELAWSSDARQIAFTRGGTLEDDAPSNIDSRPEGTASREIWMVPLAGGEARKLGAGHNASFSPDGQRLVYLEKRQIFGVDLNDGSRQPRVLLNDAGTIHSITWSPDGRRLAFVSDRGAHALVGVYDIGSKRISWIAPSLDVDNDPVFSPDGMKIAFIRTPAGARRRSVDRRAGIPWSIWVADVSSGSGRRAWVADTGPGSVFHSTLSEQNLFWTAQGQLVFPWEKTGWLLPYAVAEGGGAARLLAPGAFETAYMTLSPDRRRLVYSSNQNDIDRLHVWTVDPTRGVPTALVAHGDGIEAYPAVAADGTIFALRGGATTPLHPAVLARGQWQAVVPSALAAAVPSTEMVIPQSVTFKAKDGLDVHAQLFLPKGGAGRHSAIMFYHGGPSRQMLAGFHYMGAYSWMYGLNEYWASKGYVVLSVNYRGGIGYGLNYREAKDFGANGASEVNDLLGAVSYLQNRSDVDTGHIGIWGGSYGGLMTAYGFAHASDAIAVGVDYAGVYNFVSSPSFAASAGDAELMRRGVASSPKASVDRWRSPVLIVTADDDRNVAYTQSTELMTDLRARGVDHEVLVLPNEVHDLTKFSSWTTLFNAADRYLTRYLKPQPIDRQ